MTKVSPFTGEKFFSLFAKDTQQLSCFLCCSVIGCLILLLHKCSRVVDAQSPMAVVIPAKGSEFSMKLRNGDVSWHDFLEKVNNLKYAH